MSRRFSTLFLILSACFFLSHPLLGQDKWKLQLTSEEESKSVLTDFRLEREYTDSLQALSAAKAVLSQLHENGYLLAQIISVENAEQTLQVQIEIGNQYKWLALSPGNLSRDVLRQVGFREKFYRGKAYRHRTVARLQSAVLDYAERNGFPFASLRLDSLRIENNQFTASLNFDPGPLIQFDSIRVEGSSKMNPRFLETYLGIRMGTPFDQQTVEQVASRLAALPYVRIAQNPRVTFQNREATLHFVLDKRPINQIDGIIGFLPNSSNDQQLVVTGQFDLELWNPFGSGKKIGLHWQRLDVSTQRLDIEYSHPHFFRGPLSADFNFRLLKQDTSFTNRDFDVALTYRLDGKSEVQLVSRFKSTNLLSTVGLENSPVLPDIIDSDFASYGLGFSWQNLDDLFVPRRGTHIALNATAGNKKFRINTGLPAELYQGLDLKSFQYTLFGQLERYWEISERMTLLNRFTYEKIFNDQLFQNEVFRLGGFRSIRGFNENFFFASEYGFLTTEGRFFLDTQSYLSVFGDFAQLYQRFEGGGGSTFAYGFGAGISFSTNAGIFNFVYALGGTDAQGGISLNQSKIHFGYTSRF